MIVRACLLAATVAALCCPPARAEGPPACAAPAELVTPVHGLPHLAGALRPGGRFEILALGSGTLLGPRGGVEGSLPDHMVASLRALAPGTNIHLVFQAARAMTATEMLTALHKELAAHGYQLVIWQTGTVEAVRKLPQAQFRQTLADGAAAAAAAGADTVLIDVPYSRLLDSKSDLAPYRAAMEALDPQAGVALFRRYDLMRHWADTGGVDLEGAGTRDRKHTADTLRACLGQALAQLLLNARAADAGR